MKKILFLIISFSLVLSGCGSKVEEVTAGTEGAIGTALEYEEFTIKLDDAYYTNFPHDGIDLNFDRYLAADFTITNSGDAPTVAKTLTNFTVTDNNNNLSRVMIDENRKKFSSNLNSGDSFDITLVFPVNDANEYTINYSYGVTASQEDVLSWTVDLGNKKQEEVENTVEHRDVGETVKTFLFGDGSNQIAFEYKPASEKSETGSETGSEKASETSSEEASEVSENE